MSVRASTRCHEVAYQDLVALLDKHAGSLSGIEMLAVASNLVGKLVAMQDQRQVTPAMAMEVVANNVKLGNQDILARMDTTVGSA